MRTNDMMTPTLFSVSYAGLWGQHALDLHAFIGKAAALGYSAVELMGKRPHLSVLDADVASLDRVRASAEERGIEIATVAGYTSFTAGADCDEVPLVEVQVAYVRELARMAKAASNWTQSSSAFFRGKAFILSWICFLSFSSCPQRLRYALAIAS